MNAGFLPSQVNLHGFPVLGAHNWAWVEWTVAVIVRICQVKADRWQSVNERDIVEVLKADVESKTQPFASLLNFPAFSLDLPASIERGYIKMTGFSLAIPVPLEDVSYAITEEGFAWLKQYVVN